MTSYGSVASETIAIHAHEARSANSSASHAHSTQQEHASHVKNTKGKRRILLPGVVLARLLAHLGPRALE